MTYGEFRVPVDDELAAVLGTSPVPGDDVGVRHVRLESAVGGEVDLTVDALGRSVTLVVRRDGYELLHLVREGAVELEVADSAPEIVVSCRTADTLGRVEVSLKPRLSVRETTLLG